MWLQKRIKLTPRARGFHLITEEIMGQLPEIGSVEIGLAHLLLQHTSASISINENADSLVRGDMESHFNELVPENAPYYKHTYEGADDMPAHIKSSLLGCELNIPIRKGRLLLGNWQGLYLGEHREHGGSRRLVVTIQGVSSDAGE
ncbi:MAG: secondary thiamine-phosphate synthase enzyme YjbQ [Pseudomonadota bacterium]|nr:secondary thiamine-phosphate synthase enzyme YjbQ [Pseudomonadota bacterium]MEE3238548.1 secondary thiamine-phosphate synthase enzyme YjbQ [Pseudomonadota bacterium]MEE3300072.1 secondary thiamine-phosphate synthase enzyme YjbQ [Pseudomonadota bacterium]|tara:strand:- start:767 stop:1204 length:438 start_codon:yes stop_codon:yes gene_type:complete